MNGLAGNAGTDRTGSSHAWGLPALFLLSGACGLVYQVLWARMLIVVFGATLPAVSTVLGAFMAGLALGSFCFGRRIDRARRPLLVFAGLEAGVGLFAFLFPHLLRVTGWLAEASWTESHPAAFAAVRFGLAFGLLLIPTAAMGATLPVISRSAVRSFGRLGSGVGLLYAANTLGAVAGVAGVTFYLMEELGLRGSGYAVGMVNLLVASLACRIGRGVLRSPREEGVPDSREHARGPASGEAPAEAPAIPLPPLALRAVLTGFVLQGFAALACEVAWVRLFIVAFSANTHYEFSIVLMAFLLGLSLGSFLCGLLLDRRRDLLSLFGGFQIAVGLMGLASVALFAAASGWVGEIKGAGSWWSYRGGIFALSFGIMLVPTLLMGASFPVVSRICTRSFGQVGRGVGDVNAANSLGAFAGALAAGLLLIPLFGTEGTFRLLGSLNLLAGAAVIAVNPLLRPRRKLGTLALAGAAAAAVIAASPREVMRELSRPAAPGFRLLFYEEGAEGITTVTGKEDGYRKMLLNGGGQVPSEYGSFQLFRLLGHLPMLLHPDPRDVLVVALGGGIALGAAAQHDAGRIQCVELVPEVVEAARREFGPFNHRILERLGDYPVELIVDDGRNFLLRTGRRYDVITGDATHPTSTDSWLLYTREFYQLCRSRLKPGGIVVQWLPFHGLPVADFKTVLRTFQSVFPHASLWRTNNYAIMVGTLDPLSIPYSRLREKYASAAVRESLEEVDLDRPFAVLGCFFFGADAYRQYVGEGALNTDDHPHLSFVGPRGFQAETWMVLMDLARQDRRPPGRPSSLARPDGPRLDPGPRRHPRCLVQGQGGGHPGGRAALSQAAAGSDCRLRPGIAHQPAGADRRPLLPPTGPPAEPVSRNRGERRDLPVGVPAGREARGLSGPPGGTPLQAQVSPDTAGMWGRRAVSLSALG